MTEREAEEGNPSSSGATSGPEPPVEPEGDASPTGRSAIARMASNPVAANLLMLLLVVGGALMATRVKQEVFPEVTLDQVVITVPFPGASPEEVEEGVVLAIDRKSTRLNSSHYS